MIDIDREQVRLLEQRLRGVGVDRRTFLKIAAAATSGPLAASLLAACGGDDEDDPTATTESAAPTNTTAAEEPTEEATEASGQGEATEAATEPSEETEAATEEATEDTAAGGDDEQIFYDLYRTQDPISHDFNANLYCNGFASIWSGLLTFDADLLPVGDWAESWDPNEDASVWTFNIRPDNTGFSNGDPVTAETFAYSWKRMLLPDTAAPYASIIFDIQNAEAINLEGMDPEELGVTVVDDWTLEVQMEGPRGLFPVIVGYVACVPCHPASVEEYGADWTDPNIVPEVVSNGPFKLIEWEHDVRTVVEKNTNHWNADNIRLETVIEPIIPAEQGLLPYEAGDVDWALVPGPDLPRVQSDPQMAEELVLYVEPGVWFLLPQVTVAPFDVLEVRQALQHAIDRERIVTVTNGLGAPAYGLMPPGVFGYFDDPEFVENHTFDVDMAMSLLEGTPYAGGQNWPEVEITLRQEQYNSAIMAEDIAAQLSENLGMPVVVNIMERNAFYDVLYQNEVQFVFIRWFYDYPDPNNGYFDMFFSRKDSGKRQAWSNEEFDDLTIAGKEAVAPEERLEVYRQCEQIMQEEVAYVPTTYMINPYIFKPWVQGLPVNAQGFTVPDGNIYTRMLSDVYVEGREA